MFEQQRDGLDIEGDAIVASDLRRLQDRAPVGFDKRALKGQCGRVEVDVAPAQREDLAAPRAGARGEMQMEMKRRVAVAHELQQRT
jgi:hypothetical protein